MFAALVLLFPALSAFGMGNRGSGGRAADDGAPRTRNGDDGNSAPSHHRTTGHGHAEAVRSLLLTVQDDGTITSLRPSLRGPSIWDEDYREATGVPSEHVPGSLFDQLVSDESIQALRHTIWDASSARTLPASSSVHSTFKVFGRHQRTPMVLVFHTAEASGAGGCCAIARQDVTVLSPLHAVVFLKRAVDAATLTARTGTVDPGADNVGGGTSSGLAKRNRKLTPLIFECQTCGLLSTDSVAWCARAVIYADLWRAGYRLLHQSTLVPRCRRCAQVRDGTRLVAVAAPPTEHPPVAEASQQVAPEFSAPTPQPLSASSTSTSDRRNSADDDARRGVAGPSSLGGGSRFAIVLGAGASQWVPSSHAAHRSTAPPVRTAGNDAAPTSHRFLRAIAGMGIEPVGCDSREEFIRTLRQRVVTSDRQHEHTKGDFCFVIVDVAAPGMSSPEALLSLMRAFSPTTSVIFTASHAAFSETAKDADGFLLRDCSELELRRTLYRACLTTLVTGSR